MSDCYEICICLSISIYSLLFSSLLFSSLLFSSLLFSSLLFSSILYSLLYYSLLDFALLFPFKQCSIRFLHSNIRYITPHFRLICVFLADLRPIILDLKRTVCRRSADKPKLFRNSFSMYVTLPYGTVRYGTVRYSIV
jgi:hypothetical protein